MCSKENISINYRMLNASDFDAVLELFKRDFITREPLHMKLNVGEEYADFVAKARLNPIIKDNISIGAFEEKTGQLVGFRISVLGRNENETPSVDKDKLPLQTLQIGSLVKTMFGGTKEEFLGTKDYVYFLALCTRDEYSNLGIASELYRQSHQIAKDAGCVKSAVIASSYYTQKIIKKFGYDIMKTINYDDYLDPVTGEKVFSGMPSPHVTIELGVKNLKDL